MCRFQTKRQDIVYSAALALAQPQLLLQMLACRLVTGMAWLIVSKLGFTNDY